MPVRSTIRAREFCASRSLWQYAGSSGMILRRFMINRARVANALFETAINRLRSSNLR
jgi:hypothetical protein